MVNYLALLGWAKDDHTTLLTRDELVDAFDLSHVSHNPAVFDVQKLEWMNNHYIQSLDEEELAARCVHFLTEEGLSRSGPPSARDADRPRTDEGPHGGADPAPIPLHG